MARPYVESTIMMTINNSAIYANDTKSHPTESFESNTRKTAMPNGVEESSSSGEVENAVKEIKEVLEQSSEKCQNQIKEGLLEFHEILKTGFTKCEKETKGGLDDLKTEIKQAEDETKKGLSKLNEFLMKEFQKCKLKDGFFRRGEFNMLMTLKIVLMVLVVVYFCSCTHVSEVQPCELKKALDSIHLNDAFKPCKYDAIKEINSDLLVWGIADGILILTSTVSFILGIYAFTCTAKKWIRIVMWLVIAILAICPIIVNAIMYSKLHGKMKEHVYLDYGKLQSRLLNWLELHYKSDDMSNSDNISNGWNNLFIQYDCCAVREVQGTKNDFDNTPWCTTSGSCQATASQIPKTCCKGVTQDDYQNASSNCHASVIAGTYRPQNCMGRIRAMGVQDIDDCIVTLMCMSLLAMLLLQIFEAIIIASFFIRDVIRYKRSKKANHNKALK